MKIKRRCKCGCGSITNYGKIYVCGHNNKGRKYPEGYYTGRNCKHGFCNHSLYKTWCNIKQRCHNKNHRDSKYYGGRGIRVCIRWRLSFPCFLKDMGEKPSKNYTIERIDNDGNYTPDNCRWATRKEQRKNQRSGDRNRFNNLYLTYKGKTKLLIEWAETTGIKYGTLQKRYYKGLNPQKILSQIDGRGN